MFLTGCYKSIVCILDIVFIHSNHEKFQILCLLDIMFSRRSRQHPSQRNKMVSAQHYLIGGYTVHEASLSVVKNPYQVDVMKLIWKK